MQPPSHHPLPFPPPHLKFPKPLLCCKVWENISYFLTSLSDTDLRAYFIASWKWSLVTSGEASSCSCRGEGCEAHHNTTQQTDTLYSMSACTGQYPGTAHGTHAGGCPHSSKPYPDPFLSSDLYKQSINRLVPGKFPNMFPTKYPFLFTYSYIIMYYVNWGGLWTVSNYSECHTNLK